MKRFLLIIAAMSVLLFTVITACKNPSSSSYACWGGFSDHCWDANEDSADACEAQGRTLSIGTCPDNGYPKDCGTYWVKSGVTCW